MTLKFDVIIVGGGIVGLTCALALAQQTTLTIALCDKHSFCSSWHPDSYSHRVSAITLASVSFFKKLGVWEKIRSMRVAPFKQIQVYDAVNDAKIFFSSEEIATTQLGYIIENNVMQTALLEKIHDYSAITLLAPVTFSAFSREENNTSLKTEDGQTLTATLAIAADGAASWLREQAGIEIHKKDYEQQAIVATVKTALPHDEIARQIFLGTGPLAHLPLSDTHTTSIVWSAALEKTNYLMSLDDDHFKSELTQAFANRLGEVVEVSKRYAYPLAKQQAKNYIKSKVVLVGDAAHTIHPLAGLGVNVGLADAMNLTQIIKNACEKHRDFASDSTLRQYERARKAENFPLLFGIDAIKNIFASEKKSVQQLRAAGLNFIDQMPWIKNLFTNYAVNNSK